MDTRPSWDEYFMEITKLTSQRSNCIKRKVGCIVVKDTRILSLGYNGTPKGLLNCFEGGCDRCNKGDSCGTNLDICVCLHAEENALLFANKSDLVDSTIYVTLFPCVGCTKKIIQCGIKRLVFLQSYNEKMEEISKKILYSSGILMEQV